MKKMLTEYQKQLLVLPKIQPPESETERAVRQMRVEETRAFINWARRVEYRHRIYWQIAEIVTPILVSVLMGWLVTAAMRAGI